VIARHGLSGTSFTRIAEEAGISSPGLISYHFAGKDELFTVLTQQLLDACADAIEEAVGAAPDPHAAVAAYVTAFVSWQDANREGVAALWRLASGWKAPGLDRAFDETPLVAPLLRVLEEGRASGALRDVNPSVVAQGMLCAVEAFHDAAAADPGLTADTFAAELVELFVRGLEVRRDG
jgi:AcrR family transcriptional regulator